MVYVLECVMPRKNARVRFDKKRHLSPIFISLSAIRIICHPQNFQVMSGMDERQQRAHAS